MSTILDRPRKVTRGFSQVADTVPDVISGLPDIGSQLDDLRLLRAGWYDGKEGVPFHGSDLDWLAGTWERLQPGNVKLPYIYPTPSGEVQAEWTLGPCEIILRIDLKEHRGRWHCMNMSTQTEEDDEERELDLEQPEEWNWLFQRISSLQEGLV